MEDSIELSDNDQNQKNQEINFFISPNNSMKKQKNGIINTASQESLAYSSETHAKYQNIDRSPSQIQIPNFQTSEKPEPLRKMIRAANTIKSKSPSLQVSQSSQHLLIQDPFRQQLAIRQDRRKTINKKQEVNLNKKCKQLQYALQVEVMSSQQLRTKVSILTELLQQKILNSQLSYFLALKNSSKNLKNIDVYIELKQVQKKLKQKQLLIEQQKQQIQSLISQCLARSSKKQNLMTDNTDPMTQIQALVQQKQSLFNYIEEVRKQYKVKNIQNKQLKQQVANYQQKQHKFTAVQRPKFILQLTQRANQIKELNEQIDKMRMQQNLICINYENQIQELKNNQQQNMKIRVYKKSPQKQSIGIVTIDYSQKSSMVQTEYCEEQEILKAQVKLLKSQRDYYIQQFKRRVNESSENYALKLQLKALQLN